MSPSKNVAWILAATLVVVGGFVVMRTNNSGQNQSENIEANLPEGLEVATLQEGSGEPIEVGSVAVVHYTGTLDDGTVFDSSVGRGVPFAFTLGAGQVIAGWDLGVAGMRVGEKRRLVIAPELAYGSVSRGPIPANSTLTFDVELIEVR